MADSDVMEVPHSRDNAPWSECGDPRGPDFGRVFVWPAAGAAQALTYDRRGRRHALTLLDGRPLDAEIVIQGRRFTVTVAKSDEARF
jgi:hypothetical protein